MPSLGVQQDISNRCDNLTWKNNPQFTVDGESFFRHT